MKRITDAEARMMAHDEHADLAALALELLVRLVENPYEWGERPSLLERLEAER